MGRESEREFQEECQRNSARASGYVQGQDKMAEQLRQVTAQRDELCRRLAGFLAEGTPPLRARYKNRRPDPGECVVNSIDWFGRFLRVDNGVCSYVPDFDEVEVYLSHGEEADNA
jgi:hypothetical protein